MNKREILYNLRRKNLKLNYEIICKKSTGSTNDDAKNIISEKNLIIIARKQTAGKGRYGRSFYSENTGGLYFTIKINQNNIKIKTEDITFFPLIAAVSVSQAVFDLYGIELLIKWPNDLLYKTAGGYKKICGILTEASINSKIISYIIVGIGLNVNNNITDFPDDIKNTASSLKIISNNNNNNKNKKYDLADILCETVNIFTQLLYLPRELLIEEYKKRLVTGIDISFSQDGVLLKGKSAGITQSGNLIARLENGEETIIRSGEINFI